jgi:hypothetical protein
MPTRPTNISTKIPYAYPGYDYDEVISRIETIHKWAIPPVIHPSSTPIYNHSLADKLGYGSDGLGLGTYDQIHHMTSEGFELFQALGSNGYLLGGNGFEINSSDYSRILKEYTSLRKHIPGTVVINDKREWRRESNRNNPDAFFTHLDKLKESTSTFKVNIVKDAQGDRDMHQFSVDEVGAHAWIIYYNPKIVTYLAPYLRPQHLIRTYHTVNPKDVPEFKSSERKNKALLSGAISKHYPLRERIASNTHTICSRRNLMGRGLKNIDILPHPGYSNQKTYTPSYLQTLSKYKVAITTSSLYGYALRKIIEATACGCICISDLPSDEAMPIIDGNIVRIHPSIEINDLQEIVNHAISKWNEEEQAFYAKRASEFYDYRAEGFRLIHKIEEMRQNYNV